MSDLIRIVDLEVWAHIGVPNEERAQRQRLLVTLDLHVGDFAEAAKMDDISSTVDYFIVSQHVKAFVAEQSHKLLETMAEKIAADLLETFPIQKLTLEIKKFILPDTSFISVEIKRARNK